MGNSWVVNLKDITIDDINLVGGKGASLGELINAGFNVPRGFCITTEAYLLLLESNSYLRELLEELERGKNLKEISKKIRDVITESELPKLLVDKVAYEIKRIGESSYYAIRSSATAEDLPTASFAGQQDSYLNIQGIDSLCNYIKKCWASLFTDRAIVYRINNGFKHQDVLISVVIQEMVDSEKSGTLFTVDPLTENRKILNIEAINGLGEDLVSGKKDPDRYIVNKNSLKVEKDTGNTLNSNQIIELSQIGLEIENHYKSPQDIEWAIYRDNIYILQSRPITTLFPIDGLKSDSDALQLYFSLGHQQNMTEAISPLGISTMKNLIPISRDSNNESRILIKNSGFIYINLSKILRNKLLKPRALSGITMLNPIAPGLLNEVTKRAAFRLNTPLKISIPNFIKAVGFFFMIFHRLFIKRYDGFLDSINNLISQYIKESTQRIEEATTPRDAVVIMKERLNNIHKLIPNWFPELGAGVISVKLLGKLSKKILTDNEINDLSLGLQGNVVKEMNLKLGDLADIVKENPGIIEVFNHVEPSNWLKSISDSRFTEAFNLFLDKYGARGLCEIDIMRPKWYEEPTTLLRVIKGYISQDKGIHRELEKKQIKTKELVADKLLSRSKGIKKLLVKRLLYTMDHCAVLREHHKFAGIRLLRPIKTRIKVISKELENKGVLNSKDDVWFLHWPELVDLCKRERDEYKEVILERRIKYNQVRDIKPPIVITSDGEIPQLEITEKLPENCLKGYPVSPGIYEGVVRVVNDPDSETLKPGEILVTTYTDPGWTSLFMNAGALLMEVGGVMTHGSVVAREYQIPAIVGLKDITSKLKTGQRIKVDAYSGLVYLLG